MSFGVYPETSLSEARTLRDKTKELLKQKINPIIDKNLSNINVDNTFKSICEKWLSRMKIEWQETTLKKVINLIENHLVKLQPQLLLVQQGNRDQLHQYHIRILSQKNY